MDDRPRLKNLSKIGGYGPDLDHVRFKGGFFASRIGRFGMWQLKRSTKDEDDDMRSSPREFLYVVGNMYWQDVVRTVKKAVGRVSVESYYDSSTVSDYSTSESLLQKIREIQ